MQKRQKRPKTDLTHRLSLKHMKGEFQVCEECGLSGTHETLELHRNLVHAAKSGCFPCELCRDASDEWNMSRSTTSRMSFRRESANTHVRHVARSSDTCRRLSAPPDPRSNMPETLLSPFYLDNSLIYGVASNSGRILNEVLKVSKFGGGEAEVDDVDWNPGLVTPASAVGGFMRKHYEERRHAHVPSDIASQILLWRSYILPREFKYSKKPKARKVVRAEFVVSTNLSDGDVDLAEDDGELDDDNDKMFSNLPLPLQIARPAFYYYN